MAWRLLHPGTTLLTLPATSLPLDIFGAAARAWPSPFAPSLPWAAWRQQQHTALHACTFQRLSWGFCTCCLDRHLPSPYKLYTERGTVPLCFLAWPGWRQWGQAGGVGLPPSPSPSSPSPPMAYQKGGVWRQNRRHSVISMEK